MSNQPIYRAVFLNVYGGLFYLRTKNAPISLQLNYKVLSMKGCPLRHMLLLGPLNKEEWYTLTITIELRFVSCSEFSRFDSRIPGQKQNKMSTFETRSFSQGKVI